MDTIYRLPFSIPFYTQRSIPSHWAQDGFQSPEDAAFWDSRGCGIASLRMILDGFLDSRGLPHCPPQGAMIHQGVLRGAYREEIGWIHQGLADMAASYGVQGISQRQASAQQLAQQVEAGIPCMASVSPAFAGGTLREDGTVVKPGGHLIVVLGTVRTGTELTALIVHHPSCWKARNWAWYTVPIERFLPSFSGNYLSFTPANHPSQTEKQ